MLNFELSSSLTSWDCVIWQYRDTGSQPSWKSEIEISQRFRARHNQSTPIKTFYNQPPDLATWFVFYISVVMHILQHKLCIEASVFPSHRFSCKLWLLHCSIYTGHRVHWKYEHEVAKYGSIVWQTSDSAKSSNFKHPFIL